MFISGDVMVVGVTKAAYFSMLDMTTGASAWSYAHIASPLESFIFKDQ